MSLCTWLAIKSRHSSCLKSKSASFTKLDTGIRWLLSTACVAWLHKPRTLGATVTTASAASKRSARPLTMRGVVTCSGELARRTWLNTAPPFCAKPEKSKVINAFPSRCAAMPNNAPIVRTPVPPTPVTAMLKGWSRFILGWGSGKSSNACF